jgi:hypothetical protein
MDFNGILNWLAGAFNWCIEHWEMMVTLFPVLGLALTWLVKKFGRPMVILGGLVKDLQDHKLTDAEIACRVWQALSVVLGKWWNVSTWVLDYAPDHQISMLKGQKFIPLEYRPEVPLPTLPEWLGKPSAGAGK